MKVDDSNKKAIITNHTILAFFFGLFFAVLVLVIELIRVKLPLSAESLTIILKQNPAVSIALIAPIVITIYFFFYSRFFTKNLYKLNRDIDNRKKREKRIIDFLQALINNDFDVKIYNTGQKKNDIATKTLRELRNTLKRNKEEVEIRRKEDELKNWMAESLAKFGDILRKNNDNPETLAFNVISNLSRHINAIQGGFYMLMNENENDKYFELLAFYAYGRKKYADQRINWGDGLISTCAVEKNTIYMTDLPDDYVKITSGLGEANPNTLLLIPLIYENNLYGVLELTSLKKFEPQQIEFCEKLGVNIANTFAVLKTNLRTEKLLEDSQIQAQTLAEQEEEMRQNMEELQATQEEAARQSKEFIILTNTVNHTLIRAEYNIEGTLLYANTRFLNKLEYKANVEVEGKPINMFLSNRDEEWFSQIWQGLVNGGRHFEGYMKHITKTGKEIWMMATYTCIRNDDGSVDKILFMGMDTTDQKKQSLNLEGIVDAVERSNLKIEFDVNGNILGYNESFIEIYKYNPREIAKLNVFDFIQDNEIDEFTKQWEKILKGKGIQEELRTINKNKQEIWLYASFSAVYDMYNEVDRVICIGQDKTREKNMEIESRQQAEILKKQEQQLRESGNILSRKLNEARNEMKEQFKEIEKLKLRSERTLEGALDAIFTINHKNQIDFFNHAAEQMWGYSKEEVMGKDVKLLFDPKVTQEDDPFVYTLIHPDMNKMVGERKEINILSKDGEIKSVLALISKAVVDSDITYTAFIQNIEVELF